MDRVQWGNLADWVAVAAAVAIAVWSAWRARRAAGQADEAQSRSTRALEAAAAAQSRLAELVLGATLDEDVGVTGGEDLLRATLVGCPSSCAPSP
jgi:hypothetical protein